MMTQGRHPSKAQNLGREWIVEGPGGRGRRRDRREGQEEGLAGSLALTDRFE